MKIFIILLFILSVLPTGIAFAMSLSTPDGIHFIIVNDDGSSFTQTMDEIKMDILRNPDNVRYEQLYTMAQQSLKWWEESHGQGVK